MGVGGDDGEEDSGSRSMESAFMGFVVLLKHVFGGLVGRESLER